MGGQDGMKGGKGDKGDKGGGGPGGHGDKMKMKKPPMPWADVQDSAQGFDDMEQMWQLENNRGGMMQPNGKGGQQGGCGKGHGNQGGGQHGGRGPQGGMNFEDAVFDPRNAGRLPGGMQPQGGKGQM